ncbi:hypothetical protein CPJCM30710_26330 [Clostridium polyendosporum]|uniref:Uncharacterized protein n=1 Tax=Clostridium polyendosporum TaxID=69208 RepID=A0A919S0P4_9CLOT|nr:hypothetical protein [Clostridium polyendosporum]GIM29967.1 hypothetical protein CPJCM30710_26330 [Clostridium polyendosporum]
MYASSTKVSNFERIFISLNAIVSGIVLTFLAVEGPLILNKLTYKTSPSSIYQIQGQDLINLILLSPLLIIGGMLLLFKKESYKYFLILTPLTVIYYVLSYTIGMEWSHPTYSGNSEKYAYYFLYLLISSLLILFYTLPAFRGVTMNFKKRNLAVYSIICIVFSLMFASMWLKEVNEVVVNGISKTYNDAPTVFWVIRYFDLGFSIPLMLLSTYLLWTRPHSSFSIQMLSYGFFITMITAVIAMGICMLINGDPLATIQQLLFFCALGIIVYSGFIFILRSVK